MHGVIFAWQFGLLLVLTFGGVRAAKAQLVMPIVTLSSDIIGSVIRRQILYLED